MEREQQLFDLEAAVRELRGAARELTRAARAVLGEPAPEDPDRIAAAD
jgi:hypothetical protein